MILKTIEEVRSAVSNHDRVIILCKTHTCQVCNAIADRLEKDQSIYADWSIFTVYVDDIPMFRGGHSVFTVPTILMFFEQKEIYRTSRFIEFDRLEYFVHAVKA